MTKTTDKREKWIASLVEVTFMNRKKISERVVKDNLNKKDFEIIELLLSR